MKELKTNFDINLLEEREKFFLKLIVELYIETGQPVASSALKDVYKLQHSSALIRIIMSKLEKKSMIEKPYTSGGRIPSMIGYNYYVKYLTNNNETDLLKKLMSVFSKRKVSIEATIEESLKIISDIVGVTTVTNNERSTEILKSIQLTALDEENYIIVLVTSSGYVESKLLKVEKNSLIKVNDIRIAIRLFKERLIDTPLIDLAEKAELISGILAEQVTNHEVLIQKFVSNIFNFAIKKQNNIYNKQGLILSRDISREKLLSLLDMMESHSIWESIEGQVDEDETLKIDIKDGDTALISKKIVMQNDLIKEISFVGSKKMNYNKALTALKFIEDNIKKKEKK